MRRRGSGRGTGRPDRPPETRSVTGPEAHSVTGPGPPLEALEADLATELPGMMAHRGMGGFLWDLTSGRVYMDPGALAVFGLRPDEFDGRMSTIDEHVIPGELPGLRKLAVDALLTDITDSSLHLRTRPSSGVSRWAHAWASVLRDEAGTAVRLVGLIQDEGAELQGRADQAILDVDRRYQSDIVYATTTALAHALSFDDMLTALTSERILEALDASGVALSVVEPGEPPVLTTKGQPAEVFGDFEKMNLQDALPIPDALRSQAPLFLLRKEVVTRYPSLWPYIEETELKSAVIMPLVAEGRPNGALTLLYERRESFNPEERNLLLALGAAVAQALQRALLYDQEHAVAIGLQQAMLPGYIPAVSGLEIAVHYQPAGHCRQVGGDWYDVVPLPDGCTGLVVGDVEGHDIGASAVMGQLRTALRAYASEGHPPATVMEQASAFLRDLDADRLATCVFATLDPPTGRALIVRAGHPHPLVRHADGTTAQVTVAGGLPLGMPKAHEAPYPVTPYRLPTDAVLLLCTDGLLESPEVDLDTGERRIRDALGTGPTRLDQLATSIVSTVEAAQTQDDDIALLLAARRGDREAAPRRRAS